MKLKLLNQNKTQRNVKRSASLEFDAKEKKQNIKM
jgi:hypothetical protein